MQETASSIFAINPRQKDSETGEVIREAQVPGEVLDEVDPKELVAATLGHVLVEQAEQLLALGRLEHGRPHIIPSKKALGQRVRRQSTLIAQDPVDQLYPLQRDRIRLGQPRRCQ